MEQTATDRLKELQREVAARHPNWPQEKTRWIAMQMAGLLAPRLRGR